VATVPCPGALAVGPVPGHVYCSTPSTGVKAQTTSNGYVAVTPRTPSQAAIPATFLPQVRHRRPVLYNNNNNNNNN